MVRAVGGAGWVSGSGPRGAARRGGRAGVISHQSLVTSVIVSSQFHSTFCISLSFLEFGTFIIGTLLLAHYYTLLWHYYSTVFIEIQTRHSGPFFIALAEGSYSRPQFELDYFFWGSYGPFFLMDPFIPILKAVFSILIRFRVFCLNSSTLLNNSVSYVSLRLFLVYS